MTALPAGFGALRSGGTPGLLKGWVGGDEDLGGVVGLEVVAGGEFAGD